MTRRRARPGRDRAARPDHRRGARRAARPADTLIARYFATRRYAGSKDRRAVRELVYAAIRRAGELPDSGRAAMLGLARDDDAIAATFDGSAHGPAPIAHDEAARQGGHRAGLDRQALPGVGYRSGRSRGADRARAARSAGQRAQGRRRRRSVRRSRRGADPRPAERAAPAVGHVDRSQPTHFAAGWSRCRTPAARW